MRLSNGHKVKSVFDDWNGVVLTAIAIVVLHFMRSRWPDLLPGLALAYLPLAYTAFNHNMWPTALSGAMVAGYALVLFILGDFHWIRFGSNVVATFGITAGTIWQKYQNAKFDNAPSVRSKITEAGVIVSMLLDQGHRLQWVAIKGILQQVQDRLGNAEAWTKGWYEIGLEQAEVERRLQASTSDMVRNMIKKFENGGEHGRSSRS